MPLSIINDEIPELYFNIPGIEVFILQIVMLVFAVLHASANTWGAGPRVPGSHIRCTHPDSFFQLLKRYYLQISMIGCGTLLRSVGKTVKPQSSRHEIIVEIICHRFIFICYSF